MRALIVKDGKLNFVEDHPDPRRPSGEALVRLRMAGICRTDLEIVKGYMRFEGVLGHEFVGIVEEADNHSIVGTRVVGEINCGCEGCDACAMGMGRHCANRTVLGILGRDGAFADFLTIPEGNLHRLPDEVIDEEAVFIEPLAAAFEILDQVTIGKSDRVAVLGDGKLGLLVAQVVATTGCQPLLLGRHVSKLAIAVGLGLRTGMVNAIAERGFDFIVDCTGSAAGFNIACNLLRPRGTIVLKSTIAGGADLNLAGVVVNELTIVGSRCGLFPPALDALRARRVQVKPMISARYPFSKGIEAMKRASERDALKILLEM